MPLRLKDIQKITTPRRPDLRWPQLLGLAVELLPLQAIPEGAQQREHDAQGVEPRDVRAEGDDGGQHQQRSAHGADHRVHHGGGVHQHHDGGHVEGPHQWADQDDRGSHRAVGSDLPHRVPRKPAIF